MKLEMMSITRTKLQELPWLVNMKMPPAAPLLLDKSESKEVLLHSDFCTLAYSHQNSLSGKQCQGVLQLFCIAARYIQQRYQDSGQL